MLSSFILGVVPLGIETLLRKLRFRSIFLRKNKKPGCMSPKREPQPGTLLRYRTRDFFFHRPDRTTTAETAVPMAHPTGQLHQIPRTSQRAAKM